MKGYWKWAWRRMGWNDKKSPRTMSVEKEGEEREREKWQLSLSNRNFWGRETQHNSYVNYVQRFHEFDVPAAITTNSIWQSITLKSISIYIIYTFFSSSFWQILNLSEYYQYNIIPSFSSYYFFLPISQDIA